ncbi:hypothetical protein A6395_15340 [Exiguobacterium sp. SH31]|uniref:hypothetical protein n=1 Tax=Exiguobacterium sp. SH31 TaxID=1843183 RepID=UPI0008B7C6DC|nr:hypothetical protein [Exiguobacterium sp. SH31]OGX77811.1 hypothetical protein A6395_15340 [Exiguobacterium sp. SH31]
MLGTSNESKDAPSKRRNVSLWIVIPATVITTVLSVYGFMTLTENEAKTEVVAKTEKTEPIKIEDEPVEPVEIEPETESVEETEEDTETEPETEAGDSALVIENQPDTTGIPFNPAIFDDIADKEQKVKEYLDAHVFYEPEHEVVFLIEAIILQLSLQVDRASSVEYEDNTDIDQYHTLYQYAVSELLAYYQHRQLAAIGELHHHVKDLPSDMDNIRTILTDLGESYHYEPTY